jgi:gas vesicle structural protein
MSDLTHLPAFEDDQLSLFELLDHVLSKGIVIAGEITISVADVDLLYLGVNLFAGSVDTISNVLKGKAE